MLITVITLSRSRGIGSGLTYETDQPVVPGMLVLVPLRRQVLEGIVLKTNVERNPQDQFDIKKISSVVSEKPLLTEAQLRTAMWIAQYYVCSLRQVLQVVLPAPPWSNLLPKETTFYSLIDTECRLRGKKQMLIIEYIKQHGETAEEILMSDTGVARANIKALEKRGCLRSRIERVQRIIIEDSDNYESPVLPKISDEQQKALTQLTEDAKPALVFDESDSPLSELYAHLLSQNIQKDRSAILLVPDVYSAVRMYRQMEELFGSQRLVLLHSKITVAQRRQIFQSVQQRKSIIVIGTRTALFAPLSDLGLVIIDNEQEWTYKSEQTPRYHARLAAEILTAYSKAKLVLASRTPSLESWHHASSHTHRYTLVHIPRHEDATATKISTIDLAQVQFGKAYPFSPNLFQAIEDRLNKKEQTVLFLNRRGNATSLLCLDCKQSIVSDASQLPMTVHTVSGKPMLIDHYSGMVKAVPAHCPNCGSTRLFAVGAGTERAESLLKQYFPSAKIGRADADTLDSPNDLPKLLHQLEKGAIDILIGTTPAIRALTVPKVTLAAMLVADIGLSLPTFRAGEKVFQTVSHFIETARQAGIRDVMIQTFRPDIPEIANAANGTVSAYLESEIALRAKSGYPPANQLICLIVRSERAGFRAKQLTEQARKIDTMQTNVSAAPSLYNAKIWHVFLRGTNPRAILSKLDLTDVVVDVDPLEVM